MWYHDHAVGITRLNAYAGLASAYIVRDAFEGGLRNLGLPDFIENGGNEIPLVIQEKVFVGANIATADPTWTGVATPGSLWYPHEYETSRWSAASTTHLGNPSAIPEMFGDTMLVNGVVHPFVKVQPRRYRLRILNATQARFLNLQLYQDNGTGNPNLATRGPDFLTIGTEGGFLAFPVKVPSNQPMHYLSDGVTVDLANPGGSLLTAPGERWDVIVDFSRFAGKSFILYNDAPAPFPMGDTLNDHHDPLGANTRTIMRFDVGLSISGKPDAPLYITPLTPLALNPLSGIDPFHIPLGISVLSGSVKLPPRVNVRQLTLNEIFDDSGRLIQMLGTNQVTPMPAGFSMDLLGTPDAFSSRQCTGSGTAVLYRRGDGQLPLCQWRADLHRPGYPAAALGKRLEGNGQDEPRRGNNRNYEVRIATGTFRSQAQPADRWK